MTDDRKTIIAVDDNVENLTTIKNTLKDIFNVYPTPSVPKMFELLEHIQPDLILLDVEMPDMNGYEAAKKLKSNAKYQYIPVIFLTSVNDAQSEIEGLNIGAVDYIHKPFVAPLLLRRVQTHLSLRDHQLEAQNASRAKGDFLSHMSHEIRSPLNAVLGMLRIAAATDDTQKIKQCIEKAEDASKHLLNIINDILDMSKIEANKLELSYSAFNVEKMLAGIINVTSIRAEEKHQNLAVTVNADVPPFIISDELRLSQVITNLLTNAIKFTPENGTVALYVIKLDDLNDEITLRIEVVDSGIGISEEQQQRLFTPYNQADNSITKNFGGTGLGLVISKQIVELMQGKIWIESELNKGSKFIFTIKAGKGTDNASNEDSRKPAGSGETSFNFKEYTILAAEDVAINREILATLLEQTGVSVDFAENGRSAVSMFQEHSGRYNLILMDVHMPEMDGLEATRKIRVIEAGRSSDSQGNNKDLRSQIPIVAMTADVFREDIEKCLSAGMDDHVGKPVAPEDLYAKLEKYLLRKE